MECNEIRELLSLYIDQMLDEKETGSVEKHLSACDACKKEYHELKELCELLGQIEMVPVPESFELRLKKALMEERRNLPASGGAVKNQKKKGRYRVITSIAAVFVVGILSFSLFKDVLGILPEKADGGDQAGAIQNEDLYGEASGALEDESSLTDQYLTEMKDVAADTYSGGQADESTDSVDRADDSADSVDQADDSAGQISTQELSSYKQKKSVVQKEEPINGSNDAMPANGLVSPESDMDTAPEAAEASDNPETGEDENKEAALDEICNYSKNPPSKEYCSRSLITSGVERNVAAVQYYNGLIEERLEGFDYQILDSSYTKAGEWKFRIFIFRGKDGNTYNEEILIIGKGGEIEVICTNELMGL